jgi:hypothetical protein
VRSQSVTAGHNRASIGRMMSIFDIPSPAADGTTDQEASSSPKSPSGSDYEYWGDGWLGLGRSPSGSGYYCSTSSPSTRRVADELTLSTWNEANVDVGSPLPPQNPRLVSSASTISACPSINGALIITVVRSIHSFIHVKFIKIVYGLNCGASIRSVLDFSLAFIHRN